VIHIPDAVAQIEADNNAAPVRRGCEALHIQQLSAAVQHAGQQRHGYIRRHGGDKVVLGDKFAVPAFNRFENIGGVHAPGLYLACQRVSVRGKIQVVHQYAEALFVGMPEGGAALVHVQCCVGADRDLLRLRPDEPGELCAHGIVIEEIIGLRPGPQVDAQRLPVAHCALHRQLRVPGAQAQGIAVHVYLPGARVIMLSQRCQTVFLVQTESEFFSRLELFHSFFLRSILYYDIIMRSAARQHFSAGFFISAGSICICRRGVVLWP